jgi:hypothetical protein
MDIVARKSYLKLYFNLQNNYDQSRQFINVVFDYVNYFMFIAACSRGGSFKEIEFSRLSYS